MEVNPPSSCVVLMNLLIRTIFDVLGYSADSDNPEVVEMAFHVITSPKTK